MIDPQIKHIFGPVPSRRLGISLGIDIIPFKTCTFNCIYCECGETNNLTVKRRRFVSVKTIINELKHYIPEVKHLNFITFSGSGEPTLNKDLGKMIREIKKMTRVPIAVLTNGSLLHLKEVRNDLLNADLVLPSLDTASSETFSKINQPHKSLDIHQITDGLREFRREFNGQIWLEVFIVKGINDNNGELDKLYRSIQIIQPDKVQLNSLDRPPTYDHVEPVDMKTMEQIKARWETLPVEIIKRAGKRREILSFSRNLESSILNTINRRPLMIEDLEALTGKKRIELYKYIDVLEKENKIRTKIVKGKIFFTATNTGNTGDRIES